MKFESYHPTINLLFFIAALTGTLWFRHPVYLGISFVAAFVYSVHLNGVKALVFNLVLLPLAAAYTWWYGFYHHFGMTVLGRNFAGNDITLESYVYGAVLALTVAAAIMWMSCVFAVFSSDKIVYLFGRISPKLSLFLSILLRSVPQIKARARKIRIAQCGIGRGPGQGNIGRRIINCLRLLSILITWTLESFGTSSASMKSRGYALKGRTAFSIYRFDHRDRTVVIVLFICLTLTAMAVMLDQTYILYDPEIIFNRITWVSYIFYAAYAVMLLLPLGLELYGAQRLRSSLAGAYQQRGRTVMNL